MTRFLNHIGARKKREVYGLRAPRPVLAFLGKIASASQRRTSLEYRWLSRSIKTESPNSWVRKAAAVQRVICAAQDGLVGERVQQFVVTRARLVSAGEDRIDHTQPRVRADRAGARRRHPPRLRRKCAALCSSARTTVVPIATTRRPSQHARRNAARSPTGMRYGSSNGSMRSRSASPVEEMPAACVSVANSMPCCERGEHLPIERETGGRRLVRHRFAPRSESTHPTAATARCMCAYWIGRPWRASPAQTSATEFSNRRAIRRG